MLKKKTVKGADDLLSVTFETSVEGKAKSVALVGDFNDWDPKRTPMKKRKDGVWSTTVRLNKEQPKYVYRYVVDGNWVTDQEADEIIKNEFGGTNGVIRIH